MAALPTPPHPNTATRVAPADAAGVHRGAEAGHHAATEQARGLRPRAVDLGGLPGGDQRLLGERTDAERGAERRAVGERHLLGRVEGGEAVPGPAALARTARAAHRPPVQDHEVAGRDVADVGTDRLDDARGLVAEQEREVVVDRAFAVVQVGVAHAARLHAHAASPGPGSGTTISRTSTGAPFASATTPLTVALAMAFVYRTAMVARTGRWSEPRGGRTSDASTSI